MNKFAVIVFSEEKKAYEGLHALQQLHAEGTLTVYETGVVERDPGGAVRVLKRNDQGPIGLGVGALVGGLVGLFGGPLAAAVGAAVGGAAGGVRDELHMIMSDEFLDRVEQRLAPGKFAVITEISEQWVAPLDLRMAELGGKVVREERDAFAVDLLEQRMNRRRAALAQRKAERARAKAEEAAQRAGSEAAEMERLLELEIEDARWALTSMVNSAEKRVDQMEQELNAKVKALEAQAAGAKPWVKSYVDARIAEMRKEYAERKQKLTKANELTREALRY